MWSRLPAAVILAVLAAGRLPAADPAFPPPAAAGPAKVPGVVVTPDIPFATAGGEALALDLAVPAGPGPFPVVVCLHGGAWRVGSRKDLSRPVPGLLFGPPGASLIETLAGKGFAAASVSYRLAPKHKFPAQIVDCATAVRFLRANATKYRLDPARVGALGFSAGGHLAALLGLASGVPEFTGPLYPDQSSRVGAVVDFFGPADLTLYGETPGVERTYFVPLLGAASADDPAAYRKASPIEYVYKASPPFLILHGTADIIVPIVHSERLHEKLLAAGVRSEFVAVKGKGHGWGPPTAGDTTAAAVRFLADTLGGGK